MAAKKPTGYRVVGAAAVVRNGKVERYVYRGGEFGADTIDNAEHLLGVGLIEPVESDTPKSKTAGKESADADDSQAD